MVQFTGSDDEKKFIDWLIEQIDEGVKSQDNKSLHFWGIRAEQAKEETNSLVLGYFIYCNGDSKKFTTAITKLSSMAKNKSDQESDKFLAYIYDKESTFYKKSIEMFKIIFAT